MSKLYIFPENQDLKVLPMSFMRTRRIAMVILMLMGILMIGCGIYFALQSQWRTIGFLLLVSGAAITLIAFILFKIWKKRPLPPSPATEGPGPIPDKKKRK